MTGLVVKEKIGLELAQELPLGQAAQEHGFIDLDVPVHQGADGALVRRRAARCDQRGADAHGGRAGLLQALQGKQQGLERAIGQRLRRLLDLMLLKGLQTLRLVDLLGFVAEQNRVAVKGNAHFSRVRIAGMDRARIDLRGRHARVECGTHIAQVGA